MIQIYNRHTGQYEPEPVAGEAWIRWLYQTSVGKMTLEALVKRRWYSLLTGWYCDSAHSRRLIPNFIAQYQIPMEEAELPVEAFTSFNDFFTRRLKPEARPFDVSPEAVLSPGDGRLQVFPQIDPAHVWQIKGSFYLLRHLLQDDTLVQRFAGGSSCLLRLAPIDYHRFHFIDDGHFSPARFLRGSYYSVNPEALRVVRGVFCRNVRCLTLQQTAHLGQVLYVEVGATSVGSILQQHPAGGHARRGQEKGWFQFGGSTILLFFEPGKICFDEVLCMQSAQGKETKVLAGERIGTVVGCI